MESATLQTFAFFLWLPAVSSADQAACFVVTLAPCTGFTATQPPVQADRADNALLFYSYLSAAWRLNAAFGLHEAPMVTVLLSELVDAFHFANSGAPDESSAFVNLDTGSIHCTSSTIELEEEPPEDLETSDRYLALPSKNELDLGRELALSFVEQQLPNEYERSQGFFRSKGAYGRFKNLLESRGAVEKWYAFEAEATEAGLRAWCQENGIQLSHAKPAA
ncbi:MAG: hypothetical protein ABI411_19200 [Tahibacter sp.]